MRDFLEESKESITPLLWKGLFPSTPHWEQFIKHFDYQFNNKDYPHKITVGPSTNMVNGTLLKERFYVAAFQADVSFYPHLKHVFEWLSDWYGEQHDNAFALMNFVGNELPVGMHFDRRDSFYWQCIGTSTWEIFKPEESDEPVEVYNLSPGDVLFIPEGAYHNIRTTEARAAISICFNSKTKF